VRDATIRVALVSVEAAPTYAPSAANDGAGLRAGAAAPVSRSRSSRRAARPSRPAPRPQPVAPVAPVGVCGKTLLYSSLRCVSPRGHAGGCIGDAPARTTAPTQDVDSVLAGRAESGTLFASGPVTVPVDDAQAARFAHVIEAAWDDTPPAPLSEPEADASVERFRNLMLD